MFLLFTPLTTGGAIAFDTSQSSANFLEEKSIRDELAEEMQSVSKNKVVESLSGRSKNGLSFELLAHYFFRNWIIIGEHAEVANIGGKEKNKPGFDSNAWLFEMVCP